MAGALQQRDFRLLWGGQFVSDFGRQLTIFAFPTIAILGLHARAESVTALTGSEFGVIPLFAMVAGVLIDRWRRRHTMIAANAVRLLALASVPAAALFHALTMAQLVAVATIVSLAGLFFDTAYQPFLTTLVGRQSYEAGNARMTLSAQLAVALGNAIAGPVIAVLGAPLALCGNVVTYALGTAALLRIRAAEQPLRGTSRSFRREFREGAALVTADPHLRSLALTTALFYLGGTLVDSMLPLYAYRTLHLTPLAFGAALAAASTGVVLAPRLLRATRVAGVGAIVSVAALATAAGDLLCVLAFAPLAGLVLGRAIVAMSAPAYEMTVQTAATARVADRFLARMNAALRTLTNVAIPVGCFASGLLGARFGFVPVMIAGCAILACSPLALYALRRKGRTHMCSCSMTTTSALPSAA